MALFNRELLRKENARLIVYLGQLNTERYSKIAAEFSDLKTRTCEEAAEFMQVNFALNNLLKIVEDEIAAEEEAAANAKSAAGGTG
jgi:hypothetical protein